MPSLQPSECLLFSVSPAPQCCAVRRYMAHSEVTFFDPQSVLADKRGGRIGELRPGLANINAVVIVLEKQHLKAPQGPMWNVLVGDQTGCMTMVCEEEVGMALLEADILKVEQATTSMHPHSRELLLHPGLVHRIADFEMNFHEHNWRDWAWTKGEDGEWKPERRGPPAGHLPTPDLAGFAAVAPVGSKLEDTG